MSVFDKIKAAYIVKNIVDGKGVNGLKNWKTTVSGILSALPQLLPLLGFPIPAEVANSISALGLFLIGLFAKDSNVTGGTVSQ